MQNIEQEQNVQNMQKMLRGKCARGAIYAEHANLPNQTYQTKPTEANQPKQTNRSKPTEANHPKQNYQTKTNKPKLTNQN